MAVAVQNSLSAVFLQFSLFNIKYCDLCLFNFEPEHCAIVTFATVYMSLSVRCLQGFCVYTVEKLSRRVEGENKFIHTLCCVFCLYGDQMQKDRGEKALAASNPRPSRTHVVPHSRDFTTTPSLSSQRERLMRE